MKHEDRAKIVKNANLISQALEVAAKLYEVDANLADEEHVRLGETTSAAQNMLRVRQQFLQQARECRELAEMFSDMQE